MSFSITISCQNSSGHGRGLCYRPLTPQPTNLNASTVTFGMLAFKVGSSGIEVGLNYQRVRQLA